jgi:hypothetical protein
MTPAQKTSGNKPKSITMFVVRNAIVFEKVHPLMSIADATKIIRRDLDHRCNLLEAKHAPATKAVSPVPAVPAETNPFEAFENDVLTSNSINRTSLAAKHSQSSEQVKKWLEALVAKGSLVKIPHGPNFRFQKATSKTSKPNDETDKKHDQEYDAVRKTAIYKIIKNQKGDFLFWLNAGLERGKRSDSQETKWDANVFCLGTFT